MAEVTTYVTQKLVSINDSGPIYPLGGIYGPTMPQITAVSEIALLIQKGYKVIEHLKNGNEVKLTIADYNIDLNGDEGAYLNDVKSPVEEATPIPTAEEKAAASAAATKAAEEAAAKAAADAKSAAATTASATTVTATPAATTTTDKSATVATSTDSKTTVVVSSSASKADSVTTK